VLNGHIMCSVLGLSAGSGWLVLSSLVSLRLSCSLYFLGIKGLVIIYLEPHPIYIFIYRLYNLYINEENEGILRNTI